MKKFIKCMTCLLASTLMSLSFSANAIPVFAAQSPKEQAVEPSDANTIRWINGTYAILTVRNQGDIALVGGMEKNAFNGVVVSQVLKRDWGIYDRASAEEKISWLLTEGHNKSAHDTYNQYHMEQYATLEAFDTAMEAERISDGEWIRRKAAYEAVNRYGENAIAAWDLSRALMLLGDYYVVGYYTYDEVMTASLEIAKKIQGMYTSWDDFTQSYLMGFAYWKRSNPWDPQSEYQQRVNIYVALKELPDGPYALDFHMPLKLSGFSED